ncbi:MAG: hypothetical protein J3R72DRAFT_494253 [Linnemannia gamsii]|nr:MAG: hypothetical protein J3R72DRAFT_494253 [Linnemannia gamsii]
MEQHTHEENVKDIDSDGEHSSERSVKGQPTVGSDDEQATPEPNLTKEASQKSFERAATMADSTMRLVLDPTDGQQQQGTSFAAASTVACVNKPVQLRRYLVTKLKELLESDQETFAVPLFLNHVDVFLQDKDTSVLSTALSLCFDLRCDGLGDNDLGRLFLAFALDDCRDYRKVLVAIFKGSLWKQAKDTVQDIVGQDSITQVVAVIIIAVISIRNLIELTMTTYGAGLSEAIWIKLLEYTAASLVKSNLANGLKDFNTMMLFVTRTSNHIPDFYNRQNSELEPPNPIFRKIVVEAHLLAECFICTFQTSHPQQRHQLVSTVLQHMPDLLFPALVKSMANVYNRANCSTALAWEITTILSNWRIVCLPSTLTIIDGIVNPCGNRLLNNVLDAVNQGTHGDPSQALRIYGTYAAYLVQPLGNELILINFVIRLKRYIDTFCNPDSAKLKAGLEAVTVVIMLLDLLIRANQANLATINHNNGTTVWDALRLRLLAIISSDANVVSQVDKQQAYQLLVQLVTLFSNHPSQALAPIPANTMTQLLQFVQNERVAITTQIAAIKTTFPGMTERHAIMLWDAEGHCPERLSIILFLNAVSENVWNLADAIFVLMHLNRLGIDIQWKATKLFSSNIDMATDFGINAQVRSTTWSRIFLVMREVFKQEDYIAHTLDSTRPTKDLATALTKWVINYTNTGNINSGPQDNDLWLFHFSAITYASHASRLNDQRWDDYFLIVNKLPYGMGAPPAGVITARRLFPLGDANGFPECND